MSMPQLSRWPSRLAQLAGILVCFTGLTVLLGWIFEIVTFKSILPGWPKMAPLTALSFLLAGLALWLAKMAACDTSELKGKQKYNPLLWSKICAGSVLVIGLLRLCGHLLSWDPGWDLLGFHEPLLDTSAPAQTSLATASNLVLLGGALLLAGSLRFFGVFQLLTLLGGLIGWLGFSQHLYGGEPLAAFASMAVHTAAVFFTLSIGILCARTDGGLMLLLVSDSAGGMLARRLLLPALLVPIVVGWLRLQAQRAGWFGTEAGLALFTLSNIVVFSALVWIQAKSLHAVDRRRKLAEEESRENQRLLQAISDNSPAVIYVKDLQGRYLLINRRYEEIFHLPRASVVGRTDHDIFPQPIAEAFRAMDQRVAAGGAALTEEESAPQDDGIHSYISVKCPLRDGTGAIYAVFGISTDITERKRAEEAMRASAERFRALVNASAQIVWTTDPTGVAIEDSPSWREFTGQTYDQWKGFGWLDAVHPDDRERTSALWCKAVAEKTTVATEYRLRHKSGEWRWTTVRAVPLLNADGSVQGWVGMNTDITGRKHAEEKLRSQLARLALLSQTTRAIGERQDLASIFQVVIRSLEDNLPVDFVCLCLYDPVQKLLTVTSVGAKSRALAMELAMPEQARIGIDQNGLSRCVRGQLVYEPDISQVEFPFPQRLRRGGLRSLVIAPLLVESNVFGVLVAARHEAHSFSSTDCEFLRQLSEHVALAAHQAQLYHALQQAYEGLRQTQQAVMQQERLLALGQMASGIAHDINNAISPVSLYTQSLLEKEPNLTPRARNYLETIRRAMSDVAATVTRMREFYRPRTPQLTLAPLNLNRLVEQVVDLTRARWSDMPQQRGAVIKLVMELADGLPDVPGVESEIREALINLVFNAVDAMPEGGTLTLRTRSLPQNLVPCVQVEVVDTGLGMDEDSRRRCFEPFFTTKGERGTGLGLAMVYGMVKRHSAQIDVESEPGKGTVVRLSFTAHSTATGASGLPDKTQILPPRMRILVVDDDPLLLKSLQDTLEEDGHIVVIASGGQVGIEAFQAALERNEPFSVVITDLGMPYVDGRKVASAVKSRSPSTPVIMLTGWGQRLVDEGDVPPHVNRVLNKPPQLPQLREALLLCSQPAKS